MPDLRPGIPQKTEMQGHYARGAQRTYTMVP
jgi:hypothetical protein